MRTSLHPDDRLAAPATSRTLTVRQWRELRAAFGGCCAYCGADWGRIGIEHVVPKSRGGDDTPDNILPACQSCNTSKGDLTLTEWLLIHFGWFERRGKGHSFRHLRVSDSGKPAASALYWFRPADRLAHEWGDA